MLHYTTLHYNSCTYLTGITLVGNSTRPLALSSLLVMAGSFNAVDVRSTCSDGQPVQNYNVLVGDALGWLLDDWTAVNVDPTITLQKISYRYSTPDP